MKPRSRAPGPLSVAAVRQEKPSSLGEAATSVRFSGGVTPGGGSVVSGVSDVHITSRSSWVWGRSSTPHQTPAGALW